MAPPSLYKPDYCNEVIECLALGHSVKGFAGFIGVGLKTVYDWLKKHEEFAAAYEIAQAKAAYFWEGRLIEFAQTGKGGAAGIIYGVGNRAREEWSDTRKHEHTGKDGEPIKTEDVSAREKLFDLIASVSKRERETEDNSRKPH